MISSAVSFTFCSQSGGSQRWPCTYSTKSLTVCSLLVLNALDLTKLVWWHFSQVASHPSILDAQRAFTCEQSGHIHLTELIPTVLMSLGVGENASPLRFFDYFQRYKAAKLPIVRG